MEKIVLFAPLLAALVAGFGWRVIGEKTAQYLTTGTLFLACALSWVLFLNFDGQPRVIPVLDWIVTGDFAAQWSIRMDRLTAIMLIVVTSVSALVHMYSLGYMAHDDNWTDDEAYRARFFAYLSFFTFTMLMLVTADNLLQMFFGWEGVGLASYLLIGFYYKKSSANAAAMKAFIVNRVGDFAFLLGIFGIFWVTGSVQFDEIFRQVPDIAQTEISFLWREWNAANLLAFLLFVGAMGKSAQLFLHTWLPDAMEGPTPVSALIHAATMVTAGVFLVSRMSPLYEFAADTKSFIVIIGASTAFFAATVGLVQNDIKRVIAYSTCSQLGYMFVAAGVGAYSVAMFHLLTHAFFKAMLFLGAGSVIHSMHHEQDMRNYGGLRKKIPLTFWAMLIGTLAITGVGIPLTTIGFAGYLSKDAIIESAYVGSSYAFWLLVISACFTSFYSWRLMFLTFWGKPRGNMEAHEHAHESPPVMTIPLGVLAVGAIFAGMVWYGPFFGSQEQVNDYFHVATQPAVIADAVEVDGEELTAEAIEIEPVIATVGGAIFIHPDNHVIHEAHEVPAWVKVSPFVAMVIGLVTAWIFYIRSPSAPRKLAESQRGLYLFLLNKWYFDEIYDFLIVRPTICLGKLLWKFGDTKMIDGLINGLALGLIPRWTRAAGRMQSGYLFHYAFAMVIGVVGLLIWVMMRGTH